MRLLESSLPVRDGARERPAYVPEQLGLEQGLGNGAAVDGDEALGPPRTAVVNRPCGELLADAGIAGDQHGARRRGHRANQVEHLKHDRGAADDAVQAKAILKLGAKIGVLRLQPPLFHRRGQLVEQFFELKRFGDEPLCAEARDFNRLPDRAEAGNHDSDDLRVAREGLVQDVPAVDAWQPEVGDQDVEGELVQPLERFLARARLLDAKPMLAQPFGNRLAKSGFVVNEKEMLNWGIGHVLQVAVF